MNRPLLLLSLLAVLLVLLVAASPPLRPSPPGDALDAVRGGAVEPPETVLSPGDRAPDFSYDTPDGATLRLHDVLAQGNVLLVFQPSEDQLQALERERTALRRRGILPIAVLDRGDHSTWSLGQRLSLHYILIPDSRAVIGAQFNVLGANTRRPEPAWFAIDRRGKIRGLERTRVPDSGFTSLAANALHLPAPDAMAPSAHH